MTEPDEKLPELQVDEYNKPEFIGIPLRTMRTDAVLDAQFYIKIGLDKFVKYRETNLEFNESIRKRLQANRHTHIYIKSDNSHSMSSYLETNVKNVLQNPKVPQCEKASVLHDASSYIVKELLVDPRSPEPLKRSMHLVESSVEFILSDKDILSHLLALVSKDYQTHIHSIEVMSFTIALGKRLGFKEGSELLNLGRAGLLHDVGKSFVNSKIIRKDGPLDKEEFNEMKRHPNFGYLALHGTGIPSENVLNVVRYHHEDLRRKGYPHGISPSEIGLDVRIVTCVDIFCALTKNRTYRTAYNTFPALKLMKEWVNMKIDKNVFSQLVYLLGGK